MFDVNSKVIELGRAGLLYDDFLDVCEGYLKIIKYDNYDKIYIECLERMLNVYADFILKDKHKMIGLEHNMRDEIIERMKFIIDFGEVE